MSIGIDIRVLARGTRTGVEEYTINLLSCLLSLEPSINYKLFYNAYRKSKLDHPWLRLKNVELKDFKIPNRLFFATARYFNQPRLDYLLKGIDVYFNPHFFIAPVSSKCRKVMTFHDLSFEHHPNFFSPRKRLWQRFLMHTRREARVADKIIASSESTKTDLINLYGIKPEKVKRIYLGVGKQFRLIEEDLQVMDSIEKKYRLPKQFVLYFGTIEPRKNLVGLIKAFELLKDDHSFNSLKLVMAGAKGWLCRDIFETVKKSKYCRDIIFTGFVEEADKPYLYNMAKIFVYPSFFEGFGFPPLEAMACGLPTIVSHTSSLPEVVGNAALMIDPYNIDELTWAMKTALLDQGLRRELTQRGIIQAKKFSWQKCAQEVLDVLTK